MKEDMFTVDDDGNLWCPLCTRWLLPDRFDPDSFECDKCLRRKNGARRFVSCKQYRMSVNNTFVARQMRTGDNARDPIRYFGSVRDEILNTIRQGVTLHSTIRWTLSTVEIYERTVEEHLQDVRFQFHSESQILLRPDEIESQVETAISQLLARILEMAERESNFVVKEVFSSTVYLARYNPVGGSSYIKTPKQLADKQAS